jgi:hypothetical protein
MGYASTIRRSQKGNDQPELDRGHGQRSRSWARRSDPKNIAFRCSVTSTLCPYMASRMARPRASSPRARSRGSGVMTNLSSLVPRTWAHLFPTASTASLPARDTQAATTVSARAHATANCKHHLLSQALFEPAVVSCRPAIWTGQLLLEGETFEVTARLSAAVCSLGPARTNLALEPLPVSESAGASSASLIPDHHIERASRRGARVSREDA